jgi:hypothetical protein
MLSPKAFHNPGVGGPYDRIRPPVEFLGEYHFFPNFFPKNWKFPKSLEKFGKVGKRFGKMFPKFCPSKLLF